MFAAKPLPPLPSADDVTGDFPVVVVVDSGISDQIPGLESWVVGRDSQVAPAYRNTDHGTFVAGLMSQYGCPPRDISGVKSGMIGVFMQPFFRHFPLHSGVSATTSVEIIPKILGNIYRLSFARFSRPVRRVISVKVLGAARTFLRVLYQRRCTAWQILRRFPLRY